MAKKDKTYYLLFLILLLTNIPIKANEQVDFLDPYIEKLTLGSFKIGGSVVVEYRYADYGTEDTGAGDFDFTRAKISLSYNKGAFSAKALYDFYYYDSSDRWVDWLQYAWLGYNFNSDHQVRVGINLVPFGLLPYSSVSWYENLSYYVGLEDDSDLGIKYMSKLGQWNLQLAYYLTGEGDYTGITNDSARYSFDLAKDEGAANREKNQFNFRLAYDYIYSPKARAEFGVSLQYGQVHNSETNRNGDHYAAAIHMEGNYNAWHIKLAAMRYEYYLENLVEDNKDIVIIGAFDFAFQVAAKATLYESTIGYSIPLNKSGTKTVMPYVEYGIMLKDKSNWDDTQFLALGAVWSFGRFYIYSDFYYAQGHPYIGPDTFLTGFSSGSGNSDWHSRVNINFSYSF
jgi:hypothetical protein